MYYEAFETRRVSQKEQDANERWNSEMEFLIRQGMRKKGLTQQQTAALIPLALMTYRKFLKKPDEMPIKIWRKLARVLGIKREGDRHIDEES